MEMDIYTGSLFGDYLYCRRKFYMRVNRLTPDSSNENLIIGKLIDEHTYRREERDVNLGRNVIDFIGSDGKIHEIKKSSRFIETHIIQLKYYLYTYLLMYEKHIEGVLNYPEERRNVEVSLCEKDIEYIKGLLKKMKKVESKIEAPPLSDYYKCKYCSYLPICRS